MLTRIRSFVRKMFKGEEPEPIEQPKEPQSTPKLITHEWPFPSPEPPNVNYLLSEMIRGVQVEGDHVFYFYDEKKRRHLRTPKGTETILARHIVWWMEGRKYPSTSKGLRTTCGEEKCIKLSHLALNSPQTVLGPQRPPKAEPKHTSEKTRKGPEKPAQVRQKLEKGDRSKCPTAKVYFATQAQARRKANEQNHPSVRGRGRKVYPYDTACPYCFGYHLTKIKQSKYNPKKVGSW